MSVTWTGGTEHWTRKGDIKLFLWNKKASRRACRTRGTIFFVHGSSMASQPTFDLHVPGRPYSSAMDWFAAQRLRHLDDGQRGLRPLRQAPRRSTPTSATAPMTSAAGSEYILQQTGAPQLLVYGISSGALKAALFAAAPSGARGASWRSTPSSGPAKAARRWSSARRSCPSSWRRTAARSTAPSCTASSAATIPARADEATGRSLRRRDPDAGRLDAHRHLRRHVFQAAADGSGEDHVPTIILRGEHDGIAEHGRPDRVLQAAAQHGQAVQRDGGISHASFQQKNYMMVYHILHGSTRCPNRSYRG